MVHFFFSLFYNYILFVNDKIEGQFLQGFSVYSSIPWFVPCYPTKDFVGRATGQKGNNGFYYKTVCGALNRTFLNRVNGCFYSRYDC